MTTIEPKQDEHLNFSHSKLMQRKLSSRPSISRPGSTFRTPRIQRCIMEHYDDTHPLESMTVTFVEDGLKVVTSALLGKGGFGKVFLARSNGGESYALKVSTKTMSENDWKRLTEEVNLMGELSGHPNIVKFYAAGRDEERAYVLMERCASQSVHDLIVYDSLDTREILWIAGSLVSTVAYIHSKSCIHRDLKPQNLLFDFKGNLKITDFGLSSRISEDEPRKTVAGTAMYMAPEMADEVYKRMTKSKSSKGLSYGGEVDTWSVGVVLYVLLTGMNPYLGTLEKASTQTLDRTQKSLFLFDAVAAAAWSWPKDWSGDARLCGLVERILAHDPKRRATLREVCEDPVWEQKPLSCPISLLRKLGLLESQSSASSHFTNDALAVPKRRLKEVISENIKDIEVSEIRRRSQLQIEYYEAFNILSGILRLIEGEAKQRGILLANEKTARSRIYNQCWRWRQASRRGGSVSLVSGTSIHQPVGVRISRSGRNSIDLTDSICSDQAEIVRAAPDQYAVVYPGRATATRWSLRSVVSLPRELTVAIEQEFRCINKHVMTKLTSMPYKYEGFDCNVCDRAILKITGEKPVFRCYKCDYDVCMQCAYSGKGKDVNFVCVTCGKKFTSSDKLRSHSLKCRGPSISPSPYRSSRMSTLLWDEVKRPSLLEVQLPDDDALETRKGRCSGRKTYTRTSTGGRITIGNQEVPSPEDMAALVIKHRDADFPSIAAHPSSTEVCSLVQKRRPEASVSLSDTSLGHPSKPSARDRAHAPKVGPQDSTPELRRPSMGEEGGDGMVKKRRHLESSLNSTSVSPQYNEKGIIIGIAARRRAESVEGTMPISGTGVVNICADTAEKPLEIFKQGKLPRSASSSNARAISKTGPQAEVEGPEKFFQQTGRVRTSSTKLNTVTPIRQNDQMDQNYSSLPRIPLRRAGSVSGHTMNGGPPLPRRGPAAQGNAQARHLNATAAVPYSNFSAIKQSRNSLVNPMQPLHQLQTMAPPGVNPIPNAQFSKPLSTILTANTAYLALPQKEQIRHQFVDDFLKGGWVRFYSFTQEDTVVMYYCLQPGRYGAMFPTEAGVGTAVLDIFSRLVLYVPCMNNESTNRNQPHPHVLTFYDEEVRILSLAEAQRYLGSVLQCVTSFIDEMTRLKAEGLTAAAVHSAYIYERSMESVSRETKFVYIRKVFPDPCGSFTLFRLSNLRSQVICNAMLDIRWQSDRRHHVGQKYYVHSDGTTEPFVVDNTGILSQVEEVLNNNYRR